MLRASQSKAALNSLLQDARRSLQLHGPGCVEKELTLTLQCGGDAAA